MKNQRPGPTRPSNVVEEIELVAEAIRTSNGSYHAMLAGFLRQLVDDAKALSENQRGIVERHLANRKREVELLDQALNGTL